MKDRTVAHGYVVFFLLEGIDPYNKSKTGIQLPECAFNSQRPLFGRVVESGMQADRGTCHPYEHEDYPLPPGTWLVVRAVNTWQVSRNEVAANTCDVIEYYPSDEPPFWAPKSSDMKDMRWPPK